jgi:hypothetical protein
MLRLTSFSTLLLALLLMPATTSACTLASRITAISKNCDSSGFCRTIRPPKGKQLIRLRLGRAKEAIAEGFDPAPALAQMLIPDAIPSVIYGSDCGMGEASAERGYVDREQLNSTLAERHGTLPKSYRKGASFLRDYSAHASACNQEYRERASSWLSTHLSRDQLTHVWEQLFALDAEQAEWSESRRLVRFADKEGTMPFAVKDWLINRQPISNFFSTDPDGIALFHAAKFWLESTAPFRDIPQRICPKAGSEIETLIQNEAAPIAEIRARVANGSGVD